MSGFLLAKEAVCAFLEQLLDLQEVLHHTGDVYPRACGFCGCQEVHLQIEQMPRCVVWVRLKWAWWLLVAAHVCGVVAGVLRLKGRECLLCVCLRFASWLAHLEDAKQAPSCLCHCSGRFSAGMCSVCPGRSLHQV